MSSGMMTQLIKKDIREKRVSLIVYCLSGALMVWLYVSIFPSLQSQAKDVAKIMAAFPKEVLKAFGAEGTGLEGVESLLVTKQFGLIWPVLAIILMLSRAGGAIAGEIETGTIGTLLSQPISRAKIYVSKYISAAVALLVFVVCTVSVNIPIISAYKLSYSPKYEVIFSMVSLLFGLSVLSVGMAVSAISNERSRVYGLVGGVVFVEFIINVVSGLKPPLDFLKYGSVFYYFKPYDIVIQHHVSTTSLLLMGITTVGGFLFGLIAFSRRDMSI